MKTQSVSLCVLLIFASFAERCFSMERTQTGVPFELYKEHLIVVRGSIGPLENLSFIIDTGATASIISRQLAQKLQLKCAPRTASAYGKPVQVESAMLPDLSVGSYKFRMIPALVIDHSTLPSAVHDVDALVGLNALKRTNFSIDYGSKLITFGDVAGSKVETALDCRTHLMVRLDVDGTPLNLMIDTGAADLILFQNRLKDLEGIHRTNTRKTIEHVGSSRRVEKVHLLHVGLPDSKWKSLDAWILKGRIDGYPEEVDGVVGPTALSLSRITFDMTNGRMSWLR